MGEAEGAALLRFGCGFLEPDADEARIGVYREKARVVAMIKKDSNERPCRRDSVEEDHDDQCLTAGDHNPVRRVRICNVMSHALVGLYHEVYQSSR